MRARNKPWRPKLRWRVAIIATTTIYCDDHRDEASARKAFAATAAAPDQEVQLRHYAGNYEWDILARKSASGATVEATPNRDPLDGGGGAR